MGVVTKTELRRDYLARRRALPLSNVTLWSALIQVQVRAMPELLRGDVYIYLSCDQEPETRGLINAYLNDGRRVFAPMGVRPGERMEWGVITALNTLVVGASGMYRPPAVSRSADEPHHGIAIVPCVAFTAQGDRLGRGGGHYDRFLASFDGPTVALAYDIQRADTLPRESHDVRVHRVATESQTYP